MQQRESAVECRYYTVHIIYVVWHHTQIIDYTHTIVQEFDNDAGGGGGAAAARMF